MTVLYLILLFFDKIVGYIVAITFQTEKTYPVSQKATNFNQKSTDFFVLSVGDGLCSILVKYDAIGVKFSLKDFIISNVDCFGCRS